MTSHGQMVGAGPSAREASPRARRLRAPLLLSLAVLLTVETVGGWILFFARLAYGSMPGEALHVLAGVALTIVYAIYQWRHWDRVAPFRARLDYAIGLIAALSMALANLSGMWLGALWWISRGGATPVAITRYPPLLSAAHNIGSMLVLTFTGAHLGAVLLRDRSRRPTR